jgi:flagellar motor switch protein FliM
MSDILSQEEVDALLSAVSTGIVSTGDSGSAAGAASGPAAAGEGGADKAVSIYDFKRPDRVSKDQMRTLQNLHENYSRILSTSLTSHLRTLIEIELISVDQLTYSEFIMSISNPSCIYVFQMDPLEGNAIFEINPTLVFYMIDRLFGGQGRTSEQNRELTSIEESVMYKITERALDGLRQSWEHVGIFHPKIATYETNPQFVQIAPPGEAVILISLEVRMANGSGLMSLCFPFMVLESIISKLSGESWIMAQRSTTKETETIIKNEIAVTDLLVNAVLGTIKVTVRDLLSLRKGDLVCTDRYFKNDMLVNVGGIHKMYGRPGLVGRRKAVQITRLLPKEEMDYGGEK